MSYYPVVLFYDKDAPLPVQELVELTFPRMSAGTVSGAVNVAMYNQSGILDLAGFLRPAVTMTQVRLAAKLLTGVVDPNIPGMTYQDGTELIAQKWIEAKFGAGPWTPIGGHYGNGAPASNYLALPNLAPGAEHVVSIRVNVPSVILTPDLARARLGISYKPA